MPEPSSDHRAIELESRGTDKIRIRRKIVYQDKIIAFSKIILIRPYIKPIQFSIYFVNYIECALANNNLNAFNHQKVDIVGC